MEIDQVADMSNYLRFCLCQLSCKLDHVFLTIRKILLLTMNSCSWMP